MIILIGGEKGGTGKSTIATNITVCLAAIGRDVLLVDCDVQQTSSRWVGERSEIKTETLATINCVQKSGNVRKSIKDLSTRYQDIVIDTGGRDSQEMRTAMTTADLFLSPIRASQSDLWTTEIVEQVVGVAKDMNPELKAFVFISMGPTNPRISESHGAQKMLADFENFQLAKTIVRDRKVFRDAMREGRGVIEMRDTKAMEEIQSLIKEVIYDANTIQETETHQIH